MKTYNELEFNKLCAEFLGFDIDSQFVAIPKNYLHIANALVYKVDYLKFHSDWNWIMEVWGKIKRLPNYEDFIHTTKLNAMKNMIFGKFWGLDSKKDLIQAIWEFLNWYNEQK